MPSHFQFTPLFSQLQFMTCEVLCGGQFKHRFHWYSRETFNHLEYFNEVGCVASFLQTPESQSFKSFTVWQPGKTRNHPRETMLHAIIVAGDGRTETAFADIIIALEPKFDVFI